MMWGGNRFRTFHIGPWQPPFGPASGTHGHKPEPGATGSCAAIPSRLLTLAASRPAIAPIALTLRPPAPGGCPVNATKVSGYV
jgi:hypothetical protein